MLHRPPFFIALDPRPPPAVTGASSPPAQLVLTIRSLPCPPARARARSPRAQMDKKYNENWIVVIGQGFAFEVTHEVKHVLWMYFCDTAVLVCKAGARQVGT